MSRSIPRWSVISGFLFAVAFPAAASHAQSVSGFYKGKTIRLLIGFGPGGGYDLYARIIAQRIGKHIPGDPTIVPQNMPGAGSLLVANYLANVAARDGTVLGTFASGVPSAPLLTPEQTKFEATSLTWIGNANNEVQIDYVWHTAPTTTLDGARRQEVLLGATGPGSASVDFPLMVNSILGFKYKLVTGYKGASEINLAMERGEVHGAAGLTWAGARSMTPDWIRDKKMIVIAQYGHTRHPDLPDVPLVYDLAQNEADRQALNLVFSRQELGRPYAAPPALPADRTQALRDAFDATMVDPDFLADAKRTGLDILPMDGKTVARTVAELSATPPDVVSRVRAILATLAQ
ncbi:MAG: tripartite tricarboxylate transporter family receptor [Hyphomicrobiales bacterium]|nr:tripartite tricarboxylate transporter family receptor [Hyphomicrobiales bacterium]